MDEFSGATFKGKETTAPTITRITKACVVVAWLMEDWERKGKIGIQHISCKYCSSTIKV